MGCRKAVSTSTVAIIILSALSGCTGFSTIMKCGYNGCPADQKITAEVQQQFNQQPELAAPNQISVQTLDGVVYLKGKVATDLQSETAESAAKAVPGVKKVVNSLSVGTNFGR